MYIYHILIPVIREIKKNYKESVQTTVIMYTCLNRLSTVYPNVSLRSYQTSGSTTFIIMILLFLLLFSLLL